MEFSAKIARSSLYFASHSVALDYERPEDESRSRIKLIISHLGLVWRITIFVTNLLKLFISPKSMAKSSRDWMDSDHVSWTEYLSVNYLPQMHTFSKLYYGVYCTCAGAPTIWQIYVDYVLAKSLRENRGTFSAQREMITFTFHGPSVDCKLNKHRCAAQVEADELAGHFHQKNLNTLREQRKKDLLSRAHIIAYEDSNDIVVEDTCMIPVNNADYLHDHSDKRLKYIFKAVNLYLLLTFLMKAPVYYFAIIGLYEFTITNASTSNWMFHFITIYGVIEFCYVFYSITTILTLVHIWIVAFYADAKYKFEAILTELDELKLELCYRNQYDGSLEIPGEIISRLHLKLWGYFNYLEQLDRIVAPYGRLLTIVLIIGLSFSHAVLNVREKAMQMVTGSVLVTIILTYITLHSISNDLEQQGSEGHKKICYLIAHERQPYVCRMMNKCLAAFYSNSYPRTFTKGGNYPMNLRSCFRTILTFLTLGIFMNRLRTWITKS